MTRRNRLFLILLISCALPGLAQENKGKFMINGLGSYGMKRNTEDQDNTAWRVNNYTRNRSAELNFGYFLSNHFAIGITGNLYKGDAKNETTFASRDQRIVEYTDAYTRAGIFARYNQPFGKSKFGLFFYLQGTTIWQHSKQEETSFNANSTQIYHTQSSSKWYGYQTVFCPGFFYFIRSYLSIETNLGALSYRFDQNTDKVNKSKQLLSTFSISNVYLGLTFYFGNRKQAKNSSGTDVQPTQQ